MIIQILAAFVATFLFALLFQTSKDDLLICGINGAISWSIYLLLMAVYPSIVLASFVAAISICFTSQIFSKKRKRPVTIYQIAGILPLVPGVGMYQTLYFTVTKAYDQALEQLILTIQIASAIAVAMLLVTSIYRTVRANKSKTKHMRQF